MEITVPKVLEDSDGQLYYRPDTDFLTWTVVSETETEYVIRVFDEI